MSWIHSGLRKYTLNNIFKLYSFVTNVTMWLFLILRTTRLCKCATFFYPFFCWGMPNLFTISEYYEWSSNDMIKQMSLWQNENAFWAYTKEEYLDLDIGQFLCSWRTTTVIIIIAVEGCNSTSNGWVIPLLISGHQQLSFFH